MPDYSIIRPKILKAILLCPARHGRLATATTELEMGRQSLPFDRQILPAQAERLVECREVARHRVVNKLSLHWKDNGSHHIEALGISIPVLEFLLVHDPF